MTKEDIEQYIFTDDIDKNTKMLLERMEYDEIIDSYHTNIINRKIEWDVIKTLLLAEKELTGTKAYYLGFYYKCIESNYDLLEKYFLMAVEKGNTKAMLGVGYYYEIVEKNYDDMKKYYHMAVKEGNKDALKYLYDYYKSIDPVNLTKEDIEHYKFSDDVDKNTKILLEYTENNMSRVKFNTVTSRKEADWKFLSAYLLSKCEHNGTELYYLGYYYEFIFKDYDEAIKYYHMAVDKNNRCAMTVLGVRYYNKKEYEKSKKYYLMAIERDSYTAMNNLGCYYENIENNYDLMKKYYLMAIEKEKKNGSAADNLLKYFRNYKSNENLTLPTKDIIYNTKKLLETMNDISLHYTSELTSCQFDNEVIKTLLDKLNPIRKRKRITNIIFYYAFIEKNEVELNKYSDIPTHNEYGDAPYIFGKYHFDNKNYEEMKKYYKKAIELSHSGAMNDLGRYYKNIEQEYEKMKKYFKMAIEHGNSNAMNNLGHYYQYIDVKYYEMKKYYEMAIEKGNTGAMNNLGYYYQHIENDYEAMIQYYVDAIEKGNEDAKDNLTAFLGNMDIERKIKCKIITYIKSRKMDMDIKCDIMMNAYFALMDNFI
ncbi:sel1 repeat family protein [bacterium]|nr:sel1 repeat family protein [bacterium]